MINHKTSEARYGFLFFFIGKTVWPLVLDMAPSANTYIHNRFRQRFSPKYLREYMKFV